MSGSINSPDENSYDNRYEIKKSAEKLALINPKATAWRQKLMNSKDEQQTYLYNMN